MIKTSARPWKLMILAPLFRAIVRSGLSVLIFPKDDCSAMPWLKAEARSAYESCLHLFIPLPVAFIKVGVAYVGSCSSSATMSVAIEKGLAPARPPGPLTLVPRVSPHHNWLLEARVG